MTKVKKICHITTSFICSLCVQCLCVESWPFYLSHHMPPWLTGHMPHIMSAYQNLLCFQPQSHIASMWCNQIYVPLHHGRSLTAGNIQAHRWHSSWNFKARSLMGVKMGWLFCFLSHSDQPAWFIPLPPPFHMAMICQQYYLSLSPLKAKTLAHQSHMLASYGH